MANSTSATRAAVVVGGANGLGRAFCRLLADDGWHVVVADIDETAAAETLQVVAAAGGRIEFERLDTTDLKQWQALHDRLRIKFSALDLLVNSAGVTATGEVGEQAAETWRWLIEINLLGVVWGCHTFVPWLKDNRRGANLINVASFAAMYSSPNLAAYNLAKAGVVSLSETLFGELRPHGVGVTVVCPGFFPSGLNPRGRFQTELDRRMTMDNIARSRLTPDEIARDALAKMRRGRLYAVRPRSCRLLWLFKRCLPTTWLRYVAWERRRSLQRYGVAIDAEKRGRDA